MSRLRTRFGIRALSIALLLAAVIGGVSLGQDRQARQDDNAITAASNDDQLQRRAASKAAATSRQRVAQREAAEKAAAEAKQAAKRASRVENAAVRVKKVEKKETKSGTVPFSGPIPASCREYSGNRGIGCALMLESGFPLAEMPCLDKLWDKESGWNHKAENPSSGAYGIPQSLPGSKMASAGADWQNNPATQIKWGLGYIKNRYQTPCGAWQFFQNNGHY